MRKSYKFTAKLEAGDAGGAYVLFPYDVEKEFGTRGKIPVQATFNGIPYTGSLIKYGHAQHMLPMLKAIREQLGVTPGDSIDIELHKDEQPRTLEVPPELIEAMERAGVLAFFERLSFSHQKEYLRFVSDAKREETRRKRLETTIQMLKDKMKTPDAPKG